MPKKVTVIVLTTAVMLVNQLVTAGPETPGPTRGETYTLKIPSALFDLDRLTLGGRLKLSATIVPAEGGVKVASRPNWATAGFPSLLSGTVMAVRRNDKKGTLSVRLEGASAIVSLDFQGFADRDLGTAFLAVALAGGSNSESVASYRDQAYSKLASEVFQGEQATIPNERKLLLLKFAHLTAGGRTPSIVEFQGKPYFSVSLGEGSIVYNELQLNQTQRVAMVLNDKLLTILRSWDSALSEIPQLYGLKFELGVPHKNFLHEYERPAIDDVAIFVPIQSVAEFTDARITSQDLVDGSIVLVNGNRTAIPLTGV